MIRDMNKLMLILCPAKLQTHIFAIADDYVKNVHITCS